MKEINTYESLDHCFYWLQRALIAGFYVWCIVTAFLSFGEKRDGYTVGWEMLLATVFLVVIAILTYSIGREDGRIQERKDQAK